MGVEQKLREGGERILGNVTTYACLLYRFNLNELRLACGDVEMKTFQPNTCPAVESLADIGHNLDHVDDITMKDRNDSDEEVLSDCELEEVHEFLSTQRQLSSSAHTPGSATEEERTPSNNEDGGEFERNEGDDMTDLSQALLRKLEETFAAELVEDQGKESSGIAEETESDIGDMLNDLPGSFHNSCQLILAAQDSSTVEVGDIDNSSAVKQPASREEEEEEEEEGKFVLLGKNEVSCLAERVDDDKMKNHHTSDSAQQDSEFSGKFVIAEPAGSVDNSDHLSPAGTSAELNSVNGLVSKLPLCADEPEDEQMNLEDSMFSDDELNNGPTSLRPTTEVQSSYFSTASPLPLFEESSLDQCDLERLKSDTDVAASEGSTSCQAVVTELNVDVIEPVNGCASPIDLFDSPSETSPAASPHAQSVPISQQGSQTPPCSNICTPPPVESPQVQAGVLSQQDNQISSHTSTSFSVENLQAQLQILAEQAAQSPDEAPEVEIINVVEAKEQASDHPDNSVASCDAATAVSPLPGQLLSSSSDQAVSKHFCLRKVRAKTRNLLSSNLANLSQDSSEHVSYIPRNVHRSARKSGAVYSDVEPDSDDDPSENQNVRSEVSHFSCPPSLRCSLSSSQSTKECYVRLTRIDDAGVLLQVMSLNSKHG